MRPLPTNKTFYPELRFKLFEHQQTVVTLWYHRCVQHRKPRFYYSIHCLHQPVA